MRIVISLCTFVALLSSSFVAHGQESAPRLPAMPSGEVQVMLIRNCLTALNHATITGNFTLLRQLGSQSFQQRHSEAGLARTFQLIRDQRIDLSPVLVRTPRFTQRPVINRNAQLRMVGVCPTTPLAVEFDLVYQYGPQGWTIDDIGLRLNDQSAQQPKPQIRQVSQQQPTSRRSPVQPAQFRREVPQREMPARQPVPSNVRPRRVPQPRSAQRPSDSLFEQLRPAPRTTR